MLLLYLLVITLTLTYIYKNKWWVNVILKLCLIDIVDHYDYQLS